MSKNLTARAAIALSVCAGLAFVAIGAGALVAPEASGDAYGLGARDERTRAYVRALGARDLALGIAAVALARAGNRAPLRTLLSAATIVGAADAAIVAGVPGHPRASLATHLAGTAGLAAAAALLAFAR